MYYYLHLSTNPILFNYFVLDKIKTVTSKYHRTEQKACTKTIVYIRLYYNYIRLLCSLCNKDYNKQKKKVQNFEIFYIFTFPPRQGHMQSITNKVCEQQE